MRKSRKRDYLLSQILNGPKVSWSLFGMISISRLSYWKIIQAILYIYISLFAQIRNLLQTIEPGQTQCLVVTHHLSRSRKRDFRWNGQLGELIIKEPINRRNFILLMSWRTIIEKEWKANACTTGMVLSAQIKVIFKVKLLPSKV